MQTSPLPSSEAQALTPSPPDTKPAWARPHTFFLISVAVSIAGLFLGVLLVNESNSFGSDRAWDLLCFAPMFLAGIAAVFFGLVALVRMWRAEPRAPFLRFAFLATATLLVGGFYGFYGWVIVFSSTLSVSRGRQLRRFGRLLLPRLQTGDTWSTQPVAKDPTLEQIPAQLRGPLAAQWRENGRTEHASVAACARLTLDLMALGAPPKLLQDAQRDAQDEIRHAELCFSLANGLDGRPERPAPFPQAARARTLSRFRSVALAQLAVDSLVDGALHEGVSARVIAKLAQRAEHPEIRALLKTLAADEGRHCAHGWDVVEWCLEQGGAPVVRALRGALAGVPARMHSPVPEAAQAGGWERFGITGRALEDTEYAKARADLFRRVERLCAAPQLAAA